MRKDTPTSWIIFLMITGVAFIGYGVQGYKKPGPTTAQMTASIETIPEGSEPTSVTSPN